MVPKGWELKKLEDLCSPDAPITYGVLKPGDFYQGGIPLLQIKDLRDGEILTSDLHLISPALDEEYKRSRILKNDILISLVGTIGRIAKYRSTSVANIHRNIGRIRSEIHEYLYHFLTSGQAQNEIGGSSSGSSQSALNLSTLRSFRIPIPPLPEQKKIAQILSTWDKAITTTEQLLANSQQQKKALMQQLLTGKKRLLDKNGVRFSGEFKRYHFSDLLEIDRKSLGSKTDPNLEFDYISLSDVGTGTIPGALERHIFKTSPSRARRIVSPGDILLATVRPNLQGFAKVREQHEHCIASTGFAVLTPKKGTCGDYVYHYLFGSHITGQINALVVGTNYPAINSSDVSGLCIYCPHYEEQIEIAKVLNSSDELINALQQKLEALKQEKKALMQQLLTGKRRVKVEEAA